MHTEGHGWTCEPIQNCAKKILTPLKGPDNAKPDHIIKLSCGKVDTHASWKTARTSESFDDQGTIKISFFQTDYDQFVTSNNLRSGGYYKYEFSN